MVAYISAARTYAAAWEQRLEAAREAARQQYEDRILEAENEAEIAALRAQQDAAVAQAAAEEARRAEAEAQAAAAQASGVTSVGDDDQDQLADQVQQVADDRSNQTPVNTAFERAIQSDNYLYLVSSSPEGTFDGGDAGPCKLHAGDILRKDTMIPDTGIVTLKVKVSQPSSCRAGTLVTMTVAQLEAIYNAFQESMDDAGQELANANQPHVGQ